MTLPPWNPRSKAEQQAFADFVMDELARLDEQSMREADDKAFEEYAEDTFAAQRLSRLGWRVEQPKRSGRKAKPAEEWTRLDLAKRDVERMPAVFLKHWGHRNRHSRPTREDIAAAFWDLSSDEKLELERTFSKH